MGDADEDRMLERTFVISKLTLLEVGPLLGFLHGRDRLDVLEVGGNVGLWCEAFHDVFGPHIASYRAFEPMPANIELFRRRLADHLPTSQVEIVPACAGDTAGSVTIHFDTEVTTLASVPLSHVESHDGRVLVDHQHQREVEQVRLDDVIDRHIDLVKIDTEGYEWNVIAGMTEAIDAGLVDNVYFEFGLHQRNLDQSFRQFFRFFRQRGWTVYRQVVRRNYFGLNEIPVYRPRYERTLNKSMWMILASRTGPSPSYRGRQVVGRMPR